MCDQNTTYMTKVSRRNFKYKIPNGQGSGFVARKPIESSVLDHWHNRLFYPGDKKEIPTRSTMKLVQLDILQSSSLAKFADFVYNCIMHGI